MTCDRCNGLGYVQARDDTIDACRSCACRAEAEWRLRKPAIKRPVLRLVATKEEAA